MRSVAQSLRQLCRFTQHHAARHSPATRLIRQQNALIMCSSTTRSLSMLCRKVETSRFASPAMELMRSMFSTEAADSIKGSLLISLYVWCLSIFYFWGAFESTYLLSSTSL